VAGIFPGEPSVTRLIGAVPPEANDERRPRRRSVRMEATAELLLAPNPDAGTLRFPPLAAWPMATSEARRTSTTLTNSTRPWPRSR
jgi:hypothetical protein